VRNLKRGTIVAIRPDKLGLIRDDGDYRELYWFAWDRVINYLGQDLNKCGLVEGSKVTFSLKQFSTQEAKQCGMHSFAVEVRVIEKNKNIYFGLYWYVFRHMWRAWQFWIYPVLLWLNLFNNPFNTLKTRTIVSILYVFLLPALIAWIENNYIKRRNKVVG